MSAQHEWMKASHKDLQRGDAAAYVTFPRELTDAEMAEHETFLTGEDSGAKGFYDAWLMATCATDQETVYVFTDLATATLFKFRFG